MALTTEQFVTACWPTNEILFTTRYNTATQPAWDDYPPLTIQDTSLDTPSTSKQSAPKRVRNRSGRKATSNRKTHNEIEKKYRDSVSDALNGLKGVVPQVSSAKIGAEISSAQMTKVGILTSATSYIKQLEQERDLLLQENNVLRDIMLQNDWRE
ncbi:uncharacterized protein PV09_09025 [Verruconis gallopava]|uniref:BHLH domain-containing protein n=1 Tax=Verruconis gallopava TaxID=253628 RepID=A0A0D1ZYT9_9PEZI|nr:uncharacterized protein PV09_09025 [Verruconis gallopava]KIV99254.1 hypothetical protein PV09_09025 [Verruconis gallopava]